VGENLTRGEIQDLLTKFSKSNPTYREALLKNPKVVLEGQMGGKLPSGINVKAVEETPTTIYVVVPYVAKAGDELSDGDLEAVAGGKGGVLGGIEGALGGAVNAVGGALGGALGGAGGALGGLLGGGGGGGAAGGGSHGGGDTYTCNTSQGGQNTRVEFNAGVTLK
jgi:hypothetical protein